MPATAHRWICTTTTVCEATSRDIGLAVVGGSQRKSGEVQDLAGGDHGCAEIAGLAGGAAGPVRDLGVAVFAAMATITESTPQQPRNTRAVSRNKCTELPVIYADVKLVSWRGNRAACLIRIKRYASGTVIKHCLPGADMSRWSYRRRTARRAACPRQPAGPQKGASRAPICSSPQHADHPNRCPGAYRRSGPGGSDRHRSDGDRLALQYLDRV
jgi:hypothetical protein